MAGKTQAPRCLGVDPGIAHCGWGVVVRSGSGYQLVAADLLRTDRSAAFGDRLLCIYQGLCEVVATHAPDGIAIERVYHNRNVSSSLSTGAVIGIVHLIAAQFGRGRVIEFTPQQVKAASGLGGRADKKAVQRMMCRLLGVPRLNPHVSDAAACAIAGSLERKLFREDA